MRRFVPQRCGNLGNKFNRVIFDHVREGTNLVAKFRGNRLFAEALERVDQRVSEAVQAVSVLDDAFALDIVKDFANLLGTERVMIEEGNETRNRALEVDVVLPERVVGVDEESLDVVRSGIGLFVGHALTVSAE